MDNRKFLPFLLIAVVGLFIIVSLSSSLFYTLSPTERAVVGSMGRIRDIIYFP